MCDIFACSSVEPLYNGGNMIERLFCAQTIHLGPEYSAIIERLAFCQRAIIERPLYTLLPVVASYGLVC